MRFIHTSDWHLGRLFYGKHLTDDQAYVLEQFHLIVRDTKPDAVLISGDIYDRAVPPIEAVELLDDTLSRLLLDAGIPVIMIAGNHDSPERIGFGSKLMERQGLYVAGRLIDPLRPIVLDDAFGKVYFLPVPYAEPALTRAVFMREEMPDHDAALRFLLAEGLRRIPAGARKIVLAHAFVAGSAESESERPLSVGASGSVDPRIFTPFHYAALGHLHGPQRAGADHIRYSGSLLKYSFDEAAQEKGLELIDIDAAGGMKRERIALTPRYDVCKVEGLLDEILRDRLRYPLQENYMMVTLTDKQAILDARGQLSAVYPNLLQIDRPYALRGGELLSERFEAKKKDECALFGDFFHQMTGEMMSERQRQVFAESYNELLAAGREVKP